jgi:predicted GNAT family acetyltransferase
MLAALHYPDAKAFLDRVGGRLRPEEVRYSLILGVCGRLIHDPHEYGTEEPWFMTLEDNGGLAALALRTPPFEMIVAALAGAVPEMARQLVAEASSAFDDLPGVVGEPEIADLFAQAWCAGHNVEIEQTMRQRVYGLTRVEPVPLSRGRLRQAGEEDEALVGRWVLGFQEDTFGHVEPERAAARVRKQLARGEIYLWVDGNPVSLAAESRPSGRVITISMVYTPPESRNRGYASSCVATLCDLLLKSGYTHCTLYTDLSNPTSNKIYKRIGFREVCDSVGHTFTGAGSAPS